MIEWLKYHARLELEQIRQPDAAYAYIIITITLAFVAGCALVMK